MKRTKPHALNPESARKRIKAAKSNEPFMTALMECDHRGHKDAVEHWTRLHEVAHPENSRNGASAIKQGRAAMQIDMPSTRGAGRSQNRFQVADSGIDDWLADRAREAAGPSEEDEEKPPVVNMSEDRVRILQGNSPALFEIEENDDADPNYGARRSDHRLGAEAVGRYASVIEEEARRQGVEADWVKAIMYVENAHGWYGPLIEAFGVADTLFPMNINPELWSTLSDPPADLSDPRMNIRNAVTLLSRITERVDEPTLAKVASVWIFAGAEQVGDYGARVQDVYDRKVWREPFTPLPFNRPDQP